jgi:tetratricopeptide (TPR) repeat protein
MARRWVNFVGVSPLLLGMMVAVPQMVAAPGVLAQSSSKNSQATEAQRLYREGEQLRRQGTSESFQQALAKFQEALPLFRATGDSPEERLRQRNGEAENLESIGNVYLGLRQGQQSLDYYQQALQIYRQQGNSTEERLRRCYGEARTLTNIGNVQRTFFRFGSFPRFGEATTVTVKDIGELSGNRLRPYLALNSYQQALPIWRELGDRRGEADTLNGTADVYQYMRQNQQALNLYQQALQIYREVEERSGEAATLNDIAFVYRFRQRLQALSLYQQALKIYREIGDRSGETRTLKNIEDMSIGSFVFFSSFTSRGRFSRFGGATTVEDTVKNIGELSGNRLESQLTINFYQQVLSIWREVVDSPEERLRQRNREATTLNAIARVYGNILSTGQKKNRELQK